MGLVYRGAASLLAAVGESWFYGICDIGFGTFRGVLRSREYLFLCCGIFLA